MIVERIQRNQRDQQLSEPPEPSMPSVASGSPVTAMKHATVVLGIAAAISIFSAWHYQTEAALYEAMMDHTGLRHHDALGNPWFDKAIDDCRGCGVKIKSVGGR